MTLVLVGAGCASGLFHKKKKDEVAILRVHMESESQGTDTSPAKSISVLRSDPVMVNISTDPILTEADVVSARLLDAPGGFAIVLKLEETAGWRLEQYTAINPGKHLVIFAQWSDKKEDGRWLAAPLIARRMSNSELTFTPDASHEEMEKWVKGLNALAKKTAEAK